jgi:hypothetical protein
MPNKSSKYAIEGTAAHQLAEECLDRRVSPFSYINGGTVTLEDSDGEQTEYEVTANMAEAVMVYLKEIQRLEALTGSTAVTEQRFHLDWIDEDLYGTNDVSVALPFDTLYVDDYKHGQGLAVDVQYPEAVTYFSGGKSDKNPQLMYYALGAVGENNEHCVAGISLGVVQPRASHRDGPIRSAMVSLEELYAWQDEVLVPGLAETRKENAPLCSGGHCKFCPAISVCPEVGSEAAQVVGMTAKQAFSGEPLSFPTPSEIPAEKRVALYEFINQFEAWAKAVRSDTHDKMLNGHDFPGLKVVQGKGSNAKFEDEAVAMLAMGQWLGEGAFKKTLKTPTQMKKEAKDQNLLKPSEAEPILAVIEDLLAPRTFGKTVALETDKRPALTMETAADAFAVK